MTPREPAALFADWGAEISDNGLWRYLLWRVLADGPERTMTFVMLNPSTADAHVNDPTIGRCMKFARREGCNRLEVVNLFAYRSPHPSDVLDAAQAGIDVVGPANRQAVRESVGRATVVVVAWGANLVDLRRHEVRNVLYAEAEPLCLGVTKDGYPKHPLARGRSRIADDQPLMRWPA